MSSRFPHECLADCRVLVVGDVMLDRYWMGAVDRISPEAPVPIVHVNHCDERLGGAANVARNIVSLGAQAYLIGVVGQDVVGDRIRELAQDTGIHGCWMVDPNIPTTLKMRVMGGHQQLLRVDFEQKTNTTASAIQALMSPLLESIDVVVFSDYAKGVLTEISSLIPFLESQGKTVLIDPKGNDYQRYTGASIITPNRSEMREAVGQWHDLETLERKAQALRKELRLEALMVTMSEQGMCLYDDQGAHQVHAHAQEVYDVSGAGDTVLATLAVCRAMGMSWYDSMVWANKAGGIVVGKLGTSIVTSEELMKCMW